MLVHFINSMFLKSETITDRFRAGLDTPVCVRITNVESLSVDSAHGQTPVVRVLLSELRYVVSHRSSFVTFACVEHLFHSVGETFKVVDDV